MTFAEIARRLLARVTPPLAPKGNGASLLVGERRLVVFDLDSTLADTRHRRTFMPTCPQGPADWIGYHLHCTDDAPIDGTVALLRLLSVGHDIAIVTARPQVAAVREATTAWLERHEVPWHHLVFMPLDELRGTGEWKASVVETLRSDRDVSLFVDDWWPNGTTVAMLGVPFLHVTPPGIGRPRAGVRR